MSGSIDDEPGPHDAFLGEKYAAFLTLYRGRPFQYHRLLLIKALREDLKLPPRETDQAVDAFLRRRGLGVPQPSLWFSAVFGVLAAAVLLIPIGLIYLLWWLIQGP